MNKSLKIIFFGTSQFAEVVLKKLINTRTHHGVFLQVISVVTQPDKPAGRKKALTLSPVKILAEKHKIPVFQPTKVETIHELSLSPPDLFIIAAYGQIIPEAVLNIPKYGALNIHPSLLPKYRGASPIQYALLNGDEITGTTIIKMDAKMDHGPVITNYELRIMNYDNYKTLSDKLAKTGADLLIKAIPDYINGKLKPVEQNHDQSTYTKIIQKKDGLITPDKVAKEIYNMWRAFISWPGIYLESRIMNYELRIKLLDIVLTKVKNKSYKPLGFFVKDKNLYLQCANHTALKINKLQPQGKKEISAQDFINGYMK